nr:NAD(P)/FAD-dependent oxidoreductase [Dactylosporangium thailandense]
MYDVVVVGARCAGAPVAMLLARAGRRVLLLERGTLPSDKLSTLYIQQPGVALLRRWGLLDAVRDSGCPPLERVVYELGDVRLAGCASPVDGERAAYAPRRFVLDAILADAAVAAGAELRQRCRVTALLRDGERVTGVEYRRSDDPDAEPVRVRARLVVGADGMRSSVAELAGAEKLVEHPRLTCAYYAIWSRFPADFELYEGPTGWVSAVPTNDAVLVSAYYPQDRFEEVRHDAQRHYLDNVRTNAPGLFARLGGATQLETLQGTGDQQNFFRRAHGPGWALTGDAGHHKDSLTARGIGDAFLQAQLLAERVAPALGSPGAPDEALDTALADYAAERDRRLTESYQGTLLVAQAAAREQRKALLAAVGRSEELTQVYFDAVAGLRSPTELYTPQLQAMLAGR